MGVVTANELKTGGIKAIESASKSVSEVVISVRGENRYVVIPIGEYDKYRESQLQNAIEESKGQISSGKFRIEPVAKHIDRIKK